MKFLFLAFALTLPIHAQAPGVPIFEQSRTGLRTEDLTISKQVEKLLGEGKLMSLDKIENSLKFPTPVPLNLPPPKSQNLTPTKIAKIAKESGYRIGWPTMKKSMGPSSRLTQKPNPLLSMTRSTPAMPLSA